MLRSRLSASPRHVSCTRTVTHGRPFLTRSLQSAIQEGAPVDVHPEVQDALARNKPVVALETTIVTHGMPYPTNLTTARSVEKIVRDNGAIPATIGFIEGRVKIGLKSNELERLADVENNPGVVKISKRDIGPTIALKRDGGTTCSATLIFAALAGIKVFATGGLGGVHRGGETTMDVSADLHELSRCPVGLISAGVKSILDIGRTLEYLETLGVPVVSYAETDDFPAFYTRKSGFKSPWRISDAASAAHVLYFQQQLGMSNGTLFAVPIPEQYEAIGQKLQDAVELALAEAEQAGVNRLGKEATPWLLKRVGELTKGKSLASNVALIENTARVGARIANSYSSLISGDNVEQSSDSAGLWTPSEPLHKPGAPVTAAGIERKSPGRLVVIGSSALDITAQAEQVDPSVSVRTTVPGTVATSLGGVARNMAEAAHRLLPLALGDATILVSPIGKDAFGRILVDETRQLGMRTDGFLQVDTGRTAVCNMVLDGTGGLTGGVADMDIVQAFDLKLVMDTLHQQNPKIIAVDGNLREETLLAVVKEAARRHVPVFFEPTSAIKSLRILPAVKASLDAIVNEHSPVAYIAPNLLELKALYQAARAQELTSHEAWWNIIDDMAVGSEFRLELEHLARRDVSETNREKGALTFLVHEGVAQMAIQLLPFFQHVIIKCGPAGVVTIFRAPQGSAWSQERTNIHSRQIVVRAQSGGSLVLKHFPAHALDPESMVNVTGAGDSLVGSLLASLLQSPEGFHRPASLDQIIARAQKAAIVTLQSPLAVSPHLSRIPA